MSPQLQAASASFISRAAQSGATGRLATPDELSVLQSRLGSLLPSWYAELLSVTPVIGIEFLCQAYPPERDWNGRLWCGWQPPEDLLGETFNFYPGVEVHLDGYFSIFSDVSGGGDPYFIRASDGDDPEVLQIYHERLRDIIREVRGFSVRQAGSSLSSFLDSATFDSD